MWASLLLFVGVFPMVVALFVYTVVVCFPLTLDLSAWHAPASLLPLAVLAAGIGNAAFVAAGTRLRPLSL